MAEGGKHSRDLTAGITLSEFETTPLIAGKIGAAEVVLVKGASGLNAERSLVFKRPSSWAGCEATVSKDGQGRLRASYGAALRVRAAREQHLRRHSKRGAKVEKLTTFPDRGPGLRRRRRSAACR
jgi:hypothetical protein